jgi:hypothetical protein
MQTVRQKRDGCKSAAAIVRACGLSVTPGRHRVAPHPPLVMRGLDPRIHPGIELRFRAMDCRIKPGNDAHAAHRHSYSTVKQQASRASASSRRDCARALRFCFALRQAEGAGKTGRWLAPAVSCANAQQENAHGHTGVAETSRLSLRDGLRLTSSSPR